VNHLPPPITPATPHLVPRLSPRRPSATRTDPQTRPLPPRVYRARLAWCEAALDRQIDQGTTFRERYAPPPDAPGVSPLPEDPAPRVEIDLDPWAERARLTGVVPLVGARHRFHAAAERERWAAAGAARAGWREVGREADRAGMGGWAPGHPPCASSREMLRSGAHQMSRAAALAWVGGQDRGLAA